LSLKEKINKVGEIKHLGNPILRKDGAILVNLANTNEDGKYMCPCPQVSGVDIEKPKTHTYIRVVRKLQFLNNFLIKTAVLQAESRKTARLVREPIGFPNKSIN
jgi:hypothetical protein